MLSKYGYKYYIYTPTHTHTQTYHTHTHVCILTAVLEIQESFSVMFVPPKTLLENGEYMHDG